MIFELLVISSPKSINQEFDQVNALFEEGLKLFHLRKPDHSKEEYEQALKQIKPAFLKRVILHDHYELAVKFNVCGFHLTRKSLNQRPNDSKELFRVAKARGLKLSSSLHSVRELENAVKSFDYMLLSPVFESISKPGHTPTMHLEEVASVLKARNSSPRIIALGGVDADRLPALKETGFNGAAVLGAIWNASSPVEKYVALRDKTLS